MECKGALGAAAHAPGPPLYRLLARLRILAGIRPSRRRRVQPPARHLKNY
jgi:hypothetical protein